MSVDIAWEQITAGPDGDKLAESIRSFVHDKFQQTTLPRFINSVIVHSFSFGSTSPSIEIKDICDPLPEFYEDEEDDENESDDSDGSSLVLDENASSQQGPSSSKRHKGNVARAIAKSNTQSQYPDGTGEPPLSFSHTRGISNAAYTQFSSSGTPGIPGGTSNMGYFHFPMSGLSGSQTPLAAVAGGGAFAQAWLNDQQNRTFRPNEMASQRSRRGSRRDSVTDRPRTPGSISSPEIGSPLYSSSPNKRVKGYGMAEKVGDDISTDVIMEHKSTPIDQVQPSDLQVVARITYDGDVQMMLTAQILLDYPMPSFVNIPLKMSITGMTFDGVALLAYIRKKMHFCFLDPEDAETLVGRSMPPEDVEQVEKASKQSTLGGLLQEIRVETEIGRQENGKQVLKNVSKVERFVLEQVRHIFEEEFVFPSFWTFLV